MNRFPRIAGILVALGLALASVAGCSSEVKSGFDQYMPSVESARAQVSHVMDAWVQGRSPAESARKDHPEVHVVDENRKTNVRLSRYEILGEVPIENARAFDVRLTFEGSTEPEVVRYIAVGVDPMWIFRREDYEGIWKHDMEAPVDRVGEPAKNP